MAADLGLLLQTARLATAQCMVLPLRLTDLVGEEETKVSSE